MTDTQNQLHHIAVAGIVLDNEGRFLLLREVEDGQTGKWTFPQGAVTQLPGNTWEVLEKNLAQNVFAQTGIEIADGPIPFTDQDFVGKDGFDTIVQFFICKYKYGTLTIQNPEQYSEGTWQAFVDFNPDEFRPLVYTVFAKADKFIQNLAHS